MDVAKQNRQRSNRILDRKIKEVTNAITEKDELELITWRFEECKDLWKDVQTTHEEFINLLSLNGDDEERIIEEEAWLEDVQKKFKEVERLKVRYQRDLQEERKRVEKEEEERLELEKRAQLKDDEATKINLAERKRALEEASFRNQADVITDHIGTEPMEEESPATSMLRSLIKDLKIQLNSCKQAQNDYMMIVGAERVDDEIGWLGKLQKIYVDVSQRAAKYLPEVQNCNPATITEDAQTATSTLKLDRMKMPTFSGNIRDYPRFKSDFIKHQECG